MTWAPCPHGVRTRGKKKDEDKAALLRSLSRDADDDELPIGERSVREGEYAHRACFLHFSSVGNWKVTEALGIVPAEV